MTAACKLETQMDTSFRQVRRHRVGNAAFDNACADHGGPRAGGVTTVRHGGGLAGLGVTPPVGSPSNQRGTLGLPTSLHEKGGVDVIGTLMGGRSDRA
jgi:hypothetical protein